MLEDIKANTKLKDQDRIDDYIARGGRLDEFVIDGRIVKNQYTDNGKTVDDCLRELIRSR